MKDEHYYRNYTFRSKLGAKMQECIENRRRTHDTDCNNYALTLHSFDTFLLEGSFDDGLLSREAFDAYMEQIAARGVSGSYLHNINSCIRYLAFFLIRQGIDCYLPPKGKFRRSSPKKTIIPSVEKLKEFARFVDAEATCVQKSKSWKHAVSYAVVFRLLFLLGLRISEALDLQRHEVRFTDCTLYLRCSKYNKNRIVAFDEGLARLLREYDNAMEQQIHQRPYFFPGNSKGRLAREPFEKWLKRKWKKCFKDSCEGDLITPHCLRHAYTVHIVDLWASQGIDFKKMLPVLSKSLGHSSVSNTYYYYHSVSQNGQAIDRFIMESDDVIPQEVRDAFNN